MPRGDGTGPMGEGPMTGRAAGYCAGYDAPILAGGPAYGCGMGLGRGAGFARGLAYGRGAGRGYRNRFYATGVPFSAYAAPGDIPPLEREEESALLKSESERLKSVLASVEQRLAKLETEEK